MDGTNLLVDSVISLSAFTGALVLISTLKQRSHNDYLIRRFLWVLYLISGVMLTRTIEWHTGVASFAVVTVVIASLIPLSVLLLTEALLRRHAPLWSKWFMSVGTVILLFFALIPGTFTASIRTHFLFLLQAFSFVFAAYWVVMRDKNSLRAEENQAISRLALALIFILPLLISDFAKLNTLFPARLSGIAVLFTCWLTVTLSRAHLSHKDAFISLSFMAVITVIATWSLNVFVPLATESQLQIASMILALLMVFSLLLEAHWNWTSKRNLGLLRHAVGGSMDSLECFLRFEQPGSPFSASVILDQKDLEEFNLGILQKVFSDKVVLRKPQALTKGEVSDPDKDQIDWLFTKYDATHILLIGQAPLRILAVNLPDISSSPTGDLEFVVFQRIAYLIAKSEFV
ncbi:hypothetical protein [Flexibacterium corallicola]|uniref:hypothetical protein n=1 Tax=Flexibacterium corallicola TaxID=3037259 RepID=UPI00286FAEB2|nr:hypothetical protein [Pseudovibrio sp. M1P-2-3]